MWIYVVGGTLAGTLVLWYALGAVWAASVAKHEPTLRASAGQARYGWRCPRCGRTEAPQCRVDDCGGALVWVQHNTRIKCSRCHRYFIPHPMLFRQTPRPRRVRCRGCGWIGVMRQWRLT